MRSRFLLRRRGQVTVLTVACVTLLITVLLDISTFEKIAAPSALRPLKTKPFANFANQKLSNEVAARFERRRQRVQEACRRLNISSGYRGMRHASQRFIFPTNTTPTVLYCPVPKTGTTFLKKTFAAANKLDKVIWVDRFFVRPVEDYNKAIMFFFTREPYSRILSAYVDKLWSPNLHFWRVLGKPLTKLIRPNATVTSLECGHDVTFPEFIQYFIDGQTRDVRINTHLVQTHKFCETCKYDYDYIGKLETFREDVAYILPIINVTSPQNYSNDDDVINDHIIQAFYTYYIDKKQCMKKHHILKKAWRALQIRGLISMSIPFPVSEAGTRTLGRTSFTKIVYKAVKNSTQQWEDQDKRLSQFPVETQSREAKSSQSTIGQSARMIHKRTALASAYNLIPVSDRLKIMKLMREEFELFGYRPKHEDVFSPNFVLNPNIFDMSDI